MKFAAIFFILFLILVFEAPAIPFLPGVGGKPSKADRTDYAERAANFDGKQFHNLEGDEGLMRRVKDEDPARMSSKGVTPDYELPVKTPDLLPAPGVKDFTLTWFGHSTLLIQMHGLNILFDPVFSKKISPVTWVGPNRFSTPSETIEQLPEIDVVVLTHDHYDHLDYQAIKKLAGKTKRFVVPLGVECHLKKWKIDGSKITNLAWWESVEIDGLSITATPARHFSGRWITGGNRTLWNSYVLKDEFRQIFEDGDSGYGQHFKQIHEKFGDFDLALMECGQYNVRWPTIHSFPEQSVQEAVELGAKLAMPIHWGAVVLSSNGWDDGVLRFSKAAQEAGLNFITPYLCQTVDISRPEEYREEWWK